MEDSGGIENKLDPNQHAGKRRNCVHALPERPGAAGCGLAMGHLHDGASQQHLQDRANVVATIRI